MHEQWKVVDEFPNYEVSNFGEIRNSKFSRPNRTSLNTNGVVTTYLCKDKKQYARSLALIVAKAFLDKPERADFTNIIHLDGNKQNCLPSNLVWRPYHFAVKYNRERLKDPFPDWSTSFRVNETNEVFDHPRDFAMKYGLLEMAIYSALVEGRPLFPGNFTVEFIKVHIRKRVKLAI
jgi:hypothetical protein